MLCFMSDINLCFISGKIVGAIDLTIGKNNTFVVNFNIDGAGGITHCVALYEVAEKIAKEYSDGRWIEIEGKLRENNRIKPSGERASNWEFLVKNIGIKNTQLLTGAVFSKPKEIISESGERWFVFKIASGSEYSDKSKLRGDPVCIDCWTNKATFGEMLCKNLNVGDQITIVAEIRENKERKKILFLKSFHVWWNALHLMRGTSEDLLNKPDEKVNVF